MTLDKIENIVKNNIRESNSLEFKHANALYNIYSKTENEINEFTKDITAMANSNGGTIIYGIQEYSKGNNRGKAKCLTPIDRDKISIEWLEQIMNSRIQPRIQKYKFFEIDINTNQFILAIELQQSTTIHQANDKRYYKRYEFQSLYMDDWEIKALINRNNNPVIEEVIYIEKKPDYIIKQFNKMRLYDYDLIIGINNIGNIMAKYLTGFLHIDKSAYKYLQLKESEFTPYYNHFEISFSNKITRTINFQNNEYEINNEYEPIMPNSWRRLIKIPITKEFLVKKIELKLFISTERTSFEKVFISNNLKVVED